MQRGGSGVSPDPPTRYDAEGRLICTIYGTIASAVAWGRFLRTAERAGVGLHYRTDAGALDAVLAVMPGHR